MAHAGYVLWGLIAGATGAWFMSAYGYRAGLIDFPNDRSSHAIPTPRGGGIGIAIAFLISAFVLKAPVGVWLPAAAISVVSFLNDKIALSPQVRLLFQSLAAFALILSVDGLGMGFLPMLLFWAVYIVGTGNFCNFMDGINGIAGVTGVVSFSLVALFAYQGGAETYLVRLPLCLAAACVGFLPFNMPRARVFMGDVGSVLLGFTFASLVFVLSKTLSDFLILSSFLFPFYADALTTLFIRLRDGDRLSQAHRKHLYQMLANQLSYSHWKVTVLYGSVQLLVGLAMLLARDTGILMQFGLLFLAALIFFIITWRVRKFITESGRS